MLGQKSGDVYPKHIRGRSSTHDVTTQVRVGDHFLSIPLPTKQPCKPRLLQLLFSCVLPLLTSSVIIFRLPEYPHLHRGKVYLVTKLQWEPICNTVCNLVRCLICVRRDHCTAAISSVFWSAQAESGQVVDMSVFSAKSTPFVVHPFRETSQ